MIKTECCYGLVFVLIVTRKVVDGTYLDDKKLNAVMDLLLC